MGVVGAQFAIGGVTRTELREKASMETQIIADDWAYIRDRWRIEFDLDNCAAWPEHVWVELDLGNFVTQQDLGEMLLWYSNRLQYLRIPYGLDICLETPDGASTGVMCYSTWLPGDEAPTFLAKDHRWNKAGTKTLQSIGLLSRDADVKLVTPEESAKNYEAFCDYCERRRTDLRVIEFNQFLGG